MTKLFKTIVINMYLAEQIMSFVNYTSEYMIINAEKEINNHAYKVYDRTSNLNLFKQLLHKDYIEIRY